MVLGVELKIRVFNVTLKSAEWTRIALAPGMALFWLPTGSQTLCEGVMFNYGVTDKFAAPTPVLSYRNYNGYLEAKYASESPDTTVQVVLFSRYSS